MKQILLLFCVFFSLNTKAQITTQDAAPMPEAVSNHAVALGMQNGKKYIYSFAGIDTSKVFSGIHKRCFRYDIAANEWSILDDLPSGEGRIAAYASTVKNKIYIIGGYHVFEDTKETSYNKVHIFNPETNHFEADGTSIPVPIDDQVQAVWRDSLIYVITGWSNTDNVDKVQIYNPTKDKWMKGKPVISNSKCKAFGASGTIIGDTIYYYGGAIASGFVSAIYFRKGIINPDDPTDITWSADKIVQKSYRSGVSTYQGIPFWLGGSQNTYNYDGVAYDGSGIVEPLGLATFYNIQKEKLFQMDIDKKVMDLRGIVKIKDGTYFVCGGMEEGAIVTNKSFFVNMDFQTQNTDIHSSEIKLFPNPTGNRISWEKPITGEIKLFDVKGHLVMTKRIFDKKQMNIQPLIPNIYFIHFYDNNGKLVFKQRIIIK